MLSISVIIPTLNERDAIDRVLVPTRRPGVERIVVDAGSDDGTRERARWLGAEQVLEGPRGRARQLEAGRRVAKGAVLLFLHADTRLEPGWDAAVRAALEDPGVAGGAFRFRFEPSRPALRRVERGVHWRCALARLPYGDQALFCRASVLEPDGIPDTPIFEDLDLAVRMRRAGRLALLPRAAWTSSRRYDRNGVGRTVAKNTLALGAWLLCLPRQRVADWYRRSPSR